MVPIYRAKKIDSDEFVEGSYIEAIQSIIPTKLDFSIKNGKIDIHYSEFNKIKVIDPTTLAIHFPDMLDSQGNKIFASLREDGKGGDCTFMENSYNIDTKVFNYELSAYRIKPEEPKFKVGDWVSNRQITSIIKQIIRTSNNSDSLTVGNEQCGINVMLKTDVELWQPKAGEWCWFYNSLTATPTLSKLISIESIYERPEIYLAETPSCVSKTSYGYSSSMGFKYCEPFIGQLPTSLKENT